MKPLTIIFYKFNTKLLFILPLMYQDIASPSVEDLVISEPLEAGRGHTRHFANLKSSSQVF